MFHYIIEILFRESVPNGFGIKYIYADKLYNAFWSAIPEWRTWNESEVTRVFLEWFWFGLFIKAEWRPDGLGEEEKKGY